MFAAFVIPGHASVASSDAQLHIKNLALSPLDSDFAAQRKIALRFCRDVAPGMTMRYPCCRPGRHDRSGSRTFVATTPERADTMPPSPLAQALHPFLMKEFLLTNRGWNNCLVRFKDVDDILS